MNNTDLHLQIPAEIVALPDLSLAERVALARIHEWPGTTNFRLANQLGISVRGVEQMLRRLRQRGLIERVGCGRARRHRLKFYVEHHTKCEEIEGTKSHTKRGENEIVESHVSCRSDAPANPDQPAPAPTQTMSPVRLVAIAVDEERERAGDCIARADFEGALHHYQLAKQRVEDFPQTMLEVRAEALAIVVEDETRVLAWKLVFEHAAATKMPAAKLKALFAVIKGLSAARLTQLRPALDAHAKLGTPVDIAALVAN